MANAAAAVCEDGADEEDDEEDEEDEDDDEEEEEEEEEEEDEEGNEDAGFFAESGAVSSSESSIRIALDASLLVPNDGAKSKYKVVLSLLLSLPLLSSLFFFSSRFTAVRGTLRTRKFGSSSSLPIWL